MSLTEDDLAIIEAFRNYVEDSVGMDERYGEKGRCDPDQNKVDHATLATRFEAAPGCWFEFAVRPNIPQIRVGFVTNDRWKSEEIEQAIQDSGDTMGEFVGIGMTEAGLDWDEPPVEHYREAAEFFYFATPLPIEELRDLEMEEVRNKVLRMLEGYLIAFGPALEGEEE
jgi:hypothetical protein